VSHCRVLRPDEFNGMSFQSHVSHCRVLPLDEFTVMIPEPCATLQGAVTWRNQCHDRATLQGVIIPSTILKIIFHPILFITRHSLVEQKARYLFYFCCFVRFLSTIYRQPAGQFTPNFACGRTLVPNVSSPLLGVGGLRRAEKGGN